MPLIISPGQKKIITGIIPILETSHPLSVEAYCTVGILKDDPDDQPQVSYGLCQTNQSSGGLGALLQMYSQAAGAAWNFSPYLPKVDHGVLWNDQGFIDLLKKAGTDSVMWACQDNFFDIRYYQPAFHWADQHGFEKALSLAVIYDSQIQSGGIPQGVRNMFSEYPPSEEGDEEMWIDQYVTSRRFWLANHKNPACHPTVYRMDFFREQIRDDNWDLAMLPINVRGVLISS